MRIVFIGGRDIHKLGGIENYMYNLATQLVKMGHEPIVFCESDHNGEEVVNGFRVIHQKSPSSVYLCKPWLGIKATWRTVRELRNVDFIHYNAGGPAWGFPIARIFGIPELIQGHGLEWQRTKWSPAKRRILKAVDTSMTRLNQHHIMCSDVQTRYYKEHYNLDCVTIPTAINLPDMERPLNSDILRRNGIKPGNYFLFLARFVKDKNPHYLIEAFRKAKLRGVQLVMAGNNPADPEFERELRRLAAGNPDIIFTGAVYGDDKEALLRDAKAFCVPSTIEGLSISLLEGMGYGLPIVASTIPANREVLDDDKAFWTEPEDVDGLAIALEAATAATPEELWVMTSFNRDRILANYTWDRVAEKYIRTLSTWL